MMICGDNFGSSHVINVGSLQSSTFLVILSLWFVSEEISSRSTKYGRSAETLQVPFRTNYTGLRACLCNSPTVTYTGNKKKDSIREVKSKEHDFQ